METATYARKIDDISNPTDFWSSFEFSAAGRNEIVERRSAGLYEREGDYSVEKGYHAGNATIDARVDHLDGQTVIRAEVTTMSLDEAVGVVERLQGNFGENQHATLGGIKEAQARGLSPEYAPLILVG